MTSTGRLISRGVSIEAVREAVDYDPENGTFIRRRTGKRADACGSRGYRSCYVGGLKFQAHNVAWAIVHGEWPSGSIDHVNMIKSDNRMANLRLSTVAENNWNRGAQANNKTGLKGVSYHPPTGKYRAKITANKKDHRLGLFDTAEDAFAAYCAAAQRLHGRFARVAR